MASLLTRRGITFVIYMISYLNIRDQQGEDQTKTLFRFMRVCELTTKSDPVLVRVRYAFHAGLVRF